MIGKKYISFTSIGGKILTLCLSLIFLIVTIIFIKYRIEWYYVMFCIIMFALCSFTTYVCFNNKIIIDKTNGYLIIKNVKSKKIKIKDIEKIKIDTTYSIDPKKYCFVIFILKDGSIYKISEYSTLITSNAVKITKKKVDYILNEIKNKNNK